MKFLTIEPLPPAPAPTAEKKVAGVYFHPDSDCSNTRIQANTSSILDLGTLKNKVKAVNIIQDTEKENYYISILYDNVGLWGKCQYIDPNKSCVPVVGNFAASASVHEYDFAPKGDGVYFYRKTCFNKIKSPLETPSSLVAYCNDPENTGGYFKVDNQDIKNAEVYEKKLETLSFTGEEGDECNVPEEEQDCVKYDKNGKCTQKSCPTLGGENISSIIINGDYLVLFTYAGPGQECSDMQLASCQEFPRAGDTNGLGPQQIKWENIRNNNGVIPNCVTIIPIQS